MTAAIRTPAERRAANASEEVDHFVELFEATEKWLSSERLDASVEAIVDRLARQQDGSLNLERLARLTVVAAIQLHLMQSDAEVFAGFYPDAA
jgi:hypothetical protein